jgi:hypothetical protein
VLIGLKQLLKQLLEGLLCGEIAGADIESDFNLCSGRRQA